VLNFWKVARRFLGITQGSLRRVNRLLEAGALRPVGSVAASRLLIKQCNETAEGR
jgi:hypothetical protein